jgi:hypothetical protein
MSPEQVALVQQTWLVVGSLSRPERILLAVRQLGQRHAAYGVEQVLEEAFTPSVREAGRGVYDFFAATMRGVPA